MAHFLSRLLADHVDPELKSLGYRRRGRRYVRVAESGVDHCVIEFCALGARESGVQPFRVELGVVLESSREFMRVWFGEPDPVPVELKFGLAVKGATPPPRWDVNGEEHLVPPMQSDWAFRADEPGALEACGEDLVQILLRDDLPFVNELVDRHRLLSRIHEYQETLRQAPLDSEAWRHIPIHDFSRLPLYALWAAVGVQSSDVIEQLLLTFRPEDVPPHRDRVLRSVARRWAGQWIRNDDASADP